MYDSDGEGVGNALGVDEDPSLNLTCKSLLEYILVWEVERTYENGVSAVTEIPLPWAPGVEF